MPPIPPNQLIPGNNYIEIFRERDHGGRTPKRFIRLRPLAGLEQYGDFAEFNVGVPGFPATSTSNPAQFNYYRVGNANIPPRPGVAPLPPVQPPVQPLVIQNPLVTLLGMAPHIGNVIVPPGTENAISYEPFNNGDEIVIIKQGGHSYYYHIEPLNQYYTASQNVNVKNPLTNLVIGNKNTGVLVKNVVVQRATVQQTGGSRRRGKTYRRKTKRARKLRRNTRRSH